MPNNGQSDESEPLEDRRTTPEMSLVDWAAKTVRSAGWIKPVVAAAAGAAVILRYFPSWPAAILSISIILIFMVLFYVLSVLVEKNSASSRSAAIVLLWFCICAFIVAVGTSADLAIQRRPQFLADTLGLPFLDPRGDVRALISIIARSGTLNSSEEIDPKIYDNIGAARVWVDKHSAAYCAKFPQEKSICGDEAVVVVVAQPQQKQVPELPRINLGAPSSGSCEKSIVAKLPATEKPVGIDISHINQDVDFRNFAARQVSFVIMKASQGASYVDPAFVKSWESAGKAGFARGAYHVFTDTDPNVQAALFASVLQKVTFGPCDIGAALDLADYSPTPPSNPKAYISASDEWLQAIHKVTNKAPLVYFGARSASWILPADEKHVLAKYPLWFARYATEPRAPAGFYLAIWQQSDGGVGPRADQLSGLPLTDANLFNGTAEEMISFLKRQ
jgi:lysozyme